MKWSRVFLSLLLLWTVLEVCARRERDRDKQQRHRNHRHRVQRQRGRARSFSDDFFDSVFSRVDNTIRIDLGDGWMDLFGNSDDSQITTHAPSQSSPHAQLPVPYSGEWVRLRALRGYINAGVVEVYRAGRWGLVCDDAWDIRDASVVCRQLGFRQGAQASPGEAHYGVDPNRWSDDDILMDDVECDGDEDSLQHCLYNDRHDCTIGEAASVVCKVNRGCAEGWVGGRESCYKFFGGAANIKAAGAKCRSLNASLVSVESMEENHLLSNLLALTASSDEHTWYTSGRLTKKTWRWSKNVPRGAKRARAGRKGKKKAGRKGKRGKKRGRAGKRRNQRRQPRAAKKRMRMMRSSVVSSRWFPGWGEAGEGAEPALKKGHTCLVLTNQFPLPNGTVVPVNYFFWKAARCRRKGGTISFVCEMPTLPQPKECYTGHGEEYRGMVDHTDIGTPCISWHQSDVTEVSHPGKGLGDHNYCRNPDGDLRPWCWVAKGKFGFCPIPECSLTTTPSPVTTTTSLPPDTPNCPANEFYCSQGDQCIPGAYLCDGEEDCEDGEDEFSCDYSIVKFEEYQGRLPGLALNNLTYANVPVETCAKYCLDNTYFICLSFIYSEDERECQLLDAGDDTPVHLLPSPDHSYFLLSSQAVNCTGKFRCHNKRCIEAEKVCNGLDDCGDLSDELNCATQPPPMKVRLVGGEENSGRVEVHYMGEWGMVCDDNWDIKDATVVCRMLGFPGADRASVRAEFGMGEGAILLDEVDCSGAEASLHDCPAAPWKKHNCQVFEAAGVVCRVNKSCDERQFTCAHDPRIPLCVEADKVCDGTSSCPDSSDEADCEVRVELKNGTSRHEGRVEVLRNGLRGTICDDDWDDNDASVVCKMLGYRYGGRAVGSATFGQGSGLIWLDSVNCTGDESSLQECGHRGWTRNDCSHLEDAGVRCHPQPPPTTTTSTSTTTTTPRPESVRVYLVNGATANEGRVELQIGNLRGTICDDSFDARDAAVICRMAGYNEGGEVMQEAHFGEGADDSPILLDEVNCRGTESSVLECQHQPLGTHNCRHSEDVGVICHLPGRPDRYTTTTPTPTSRAPPISVVDVQCGLRPMEKILSRQRRRRAAAANESDLGAPRELTPPRIEKIVGGDLAQHGMYPWQVGIQKIYNFYSSGEVLVSHWCGGTILNNHWVLSAAHCFRNLPKSRLLLRVGDHGQKVTDRGEQKFMVEELIVHPNYDREDHDYDIALLKVKDTDGQGIKFNNYVQPACLPASLGVYVAGTECLISGWGETNSETESQSLLRAARVPLRGKSVCQYLYKGVLTERMFCAGYLEGGIDTCQGDSGGPLVCKVDGVYTVLGVTSWGFGCAKPNAPGIYATTGRFLSWIEDTIRRHSSTE